MSQVHSDAMQYANPPFHWAKLGLKQKRPQIFSSSIFCLNPIEFELILALKAPSLTFKLITKNSIFKKSVCVCIFRSVVVLVSQILFRISEPLPWVVFHPIC